MICPHCNSKKVQSRGTRIRNSGVKVREFSCKECKKWFTVHLNQPQVPEDIEQFSSDEEEQERKLEENEYESLKHDSKSLISSPKREDIRKELAVVGPSPEKKKGKYVRIDYLLLPIRRS